MTETVVVDASPLILLSRIDRLDLLLSLGESVRVPSAVFREVEAGSGRDGAAEDVLRMSAFTLVEDLAVPPRVGAWDLGAGESQVLAHALRCPGSQVVLDDLVARRCARSLGLPMIGTLGLVVLCRHRGALGAARPVLEALQASGLRVRPELVEAALAKVGE